MLVVPLLLLIPGQPAAPPQDFPKERREAAVAATVRVADRAGGVEGSGVILGKKGDFVYVLTAHHLVARAKNLDIMTFSPDSYPKVHRVYRSGRVIAAAGAARDLALPRRTGCRGLYPCARHDWSRRGRTSRR
jgi:hypothetical protein